LTEQFQIIILIFFINPVSIFLNRGKKVRRWNKQADIFLTRRYWKSEILQTIKIISCVLVKAGV